MYNDGLGPATESFWVEFRLVDFETQQPYYFCDSIFVEGGMERGAWFDLADHSPRTCYEGIPTGTYMVQLLVDPANKVSEANEGDNSHTFSYLTIVSGRPDLRVCDFDFAPRDVCPDGGTPIAFSGRVENAGLQPTTGPFWIEFHVWRKGNPPTDRPYLCDSLYVAGPLALGENVDLATLQRASYALPEGDYLVGVFSDARHAITEDREDNNVVWLRSQQLRVGAPLTRADYWMFYR